MGANVHDDVLDAALDYIKTNATRMVVCSAEPTTFTEGNATYKLADVTIDSDDLTIGAGDVDGRKLTVAQQDDVDVDTSGDATHVALLDVSNQEVLLVTTCDEVALSDTGTVDFPSWTYTIRKPTVVEE
jgi:hypothetical protein